MRARMFQRVVESVAFAVGCSGKGSAVERLRCRDVFASLRDRAFVTVHQVQLRFCWEHSVSASSVHDALLVRKRRCLYRSTQRGLRELDLLLGEWTRRELDQLSEQQVNELEQILNYESLQLYCYITGQMTPPTELERLPLFQRLVQETKARSASA
ncbi:hypothetical protein CCYA_CCYA02G0687 [Cyanidiococcus yangmingshanensis]|nr:hypothetical protein CCYA_CCYA02G0687 [Cyanidiococcus yangmingshanensis]